jgi:hypothetical protein
MRGTREIAIVMAFGDHLRSDASKKPGLSDGKARFSMRGPTWPPGSMIDAGRPQIVHSTKASAPLSYARQI